MRLQAIRVFSAGGVCRLDAGKFTRFCRKTACNAGKLRVGCFYLRTAGKVTCVCRQFCTHQFYNVFVFVIFILFVDVIGIVIVFVFVLISVFNIVVVDVFDVVFVNRVAFIEISVF